MPNVSTKDDFITELKKFTIVNGQSNITTSFSNNTIVIDETEEEGKGEIYLDISSYDQKDIFFIKIDHYSNHTIGVKTNHNDGIVLKVNLHSKKISVYFFELKITLRFKSLEKASNQLVNAYRFIKYLQLEQCFKVDYKFFIAYKENNLDHDSDVLKTNNRFNMVLFNSIYENENEIPLLIPFCKYKTYNFEQLQFGSTIKI